MKLGLRLQTIDHYYELEEDREGHKGLDWTAIIGRKTMIKKTERVREITGRIITIRMGTHKETIEKTIKIENSKTTNKSNKEIFQKGKVDRMITREKDWNNNANI